jgi:alpha-soluble NSF attachment protein
MYKQFDTINNNVGSVGDIKFSEAINMVKGNSFRNKVSRFINSNYLADSITLLETALISYKKEKNISKICDTYDFMIEIYMSMYDEFNAIEKNKEALNFSMKEHNHFDRACNYFNKIIDYYQKKGDFNNAGKYATKYADFAVLSLENYKLADDMYDIALTNYEYESNQTITISSLIINYATFCAEKLQNYKKAKDLFYKSIKYIEENQSAYKYKYGTYIQLMILCHLQYSTIDEAQKLMDEMLDTYPEVRDKIEVTFISNILETLYANNMENFTNIIYEYDQISKLNSISVTLLLNIRRKFEQSNENSIL